MFLYVPDCVYVQMFLYCLLVLKSTETVNCFFRSSGWITAFTIISKNKAVGAIMIIVSILFTICAVLSVILLKMVRLFLRF